MASSDITVHMHVSDIEKVSDLIAACRRLVDMMDDAPKWLVSLVMGRRVLDGIKDFYEADAALLTLLQVTKTDGTS